MWLNEFSIVLKYHTMLSLRVTSHYHIYFKNIYNFEFKIIMLKFLRSRVSKNINFVIYIKFNQNFVICIVSILRSFS